MPKEVADSLKAKGVWEEARVTEQVSQKSSAVPQAANQESSGRHDG
jgi:hypothetical protein